MYAETIEKTKRVAELTPWELSEVEAFQNRNRAFQDEEAEPLENNYWGEE